MGITAAVKVMNAEIGISMTTPSHTNFDITSAHNNRGSIIEANEIAGVIKLQVSSYNYVYLCVTVFLFDLFSHLTKVHF